MKKPIPSIARREFLKFVAASPYLMSPQASGPIKDAASALNVLDFEEAAHRKVMPGHWAYMASGVDDDGTLRANREIFKHVQLRPSRLHDATIIDTRVELFGTTYNAPIFLCPTGGERSFFQDGELSVARAAKARNPLQILSTATSTPIEEVCKERAKPVWYQ